MIENADADFRSDREAIRGIDFWLLHLERSTPSQCEYDFPQLSILVGDLDLQLELGTIWSWTGSHVERFAALAQNEDTDWSWRIEFCPTL